MILLFLVTFITGGILGFVASDPLKSTIGLQEEPIERQRPPQGQQDRAQLMRERIIEDLQLSEDQIQPFFQVMDEHRQKLNRINHEAREAANAKIRIQADSLNAAITPVLSEEQLEKWMEMSRRFQPPPRGRPDRRIEE